MSDFTKYLPSDEDVLMAFDLSDQAWEEHLEGELDNGDWLDPIRALVLAAVQRAVADERARHAREIERARSLLASLVEHEEVVGGSLVRLSTSYRLAKSALAALDGEEQ